MQYFARLRVLAPAGPTHELPPPFRCRFGVPLAAHRLRDVRAGGRADLAWRLGLRPPRPGRLGPRRPGNSAQRGRGRRPDGYGAGRPRCRPAPVGRGNRARRRGDCRRDHRRAPERPRSWGRPPAALRAHLGQHRHAVAGSDGAARVAVLAAHRHRPRRDGDAPPAATRGAPAGVGGGGVLGSVAGRLHRRCRGPVRGADDDRDRPADLVVRLRERPRSAEQRPRLGPDADDAGGLGGRPARPPRPAAGLRAAGDDRVSARPRHRGRPLRRGDGDGPARRGPDRDDSARCCGGASSPCATASAR